MTAWPEGTRCALVLSFDVDAESSILQIDRSHARRPAAMTHQAYGAKVGVKRILRELERVDVRATFFVPGYTANRYPDMVRAIVAAGHEIGCHGDLHEPPIGLGVADERAVLERSAETIERLAGTRPQGYRAPLAEPSPATASLLAAAGFRYDSSLADDDLPYLLDTDEGVLAELPINWALDDWEQYAFLMEPDVGRIIEPPSKVAELWTGELRAAHEEGLYVVGIMHPELSGRPARARVIREVVAVARELGDVWIATAGQVAEHVLESGGPGARRTLELPAPPE